MPELPEVEVLARHLRPLIRGRRIRSVDVRRAKVLSPTSPRQFRRVLLGATFVAITRRGKYLVFKLRSMRGRQPVTLLGHLGMTGRMFLARAGAPLPKHAAVVLGLGRGKFIYEDTRYFGRLTFDISTLTKLGPEPLSAEFNGKSFARALKRSQQAIKIKLLDQTVVAGIGNIYASEALFRARIPPELPAAKLNAAQVQRLQRTIRRVLAEAIARGSTVPVNFGEGRKRDGYFYFGGAAGAANFYEERLRVYGREDQPCRNCGVPIKRILQAARSTYFCPACQQAD
jgi:formamidopyrimidine-DNA glycosylase